MSSFLSVPLTELTLDLSPTTHEDCWANAQSVASPKEQWNRYLNQMSLRTILPWLQAEQTPEASVENSIHPAQQDWLIGSAIALGSKRLVLIPSISLDTRELRVPQEWIDSPDQAGDYFLAVQIDPDDLWLRVWGYTTHAQLKTQGKFDSGDRMYCLEAESLITDLSVLWIVRQLHGNEPTQTEVAPIAALSAAQAETLLAQLSSNTVVHPRLAVPFPQWAAFLQNSNLCDRLADLRQTMRQTAAQPTTTAFPPVRLGQWLQNQFETSWQSIESLLGSDSDLAYSLRRTAELSDTAIRRVKRIHLADQDVLLVMEIDLGSDGRLIVRVQLRPFDRTQLLPTALRLAILSPTGEILQAVESREQDNLIQLQRFRCALGTEFNLQIAIADAVVVESFMV
jgi:Protein of unknown function (DUF1822)